jgi:arsenate reductase
MLRLYHNPRCSKSRQALELLEAAGKQPEIIKYLEEPFDKERLQKLIDKLGLRAMDLLRRNEQAFKTLGLGREGTTDADAFEALLTQPKLLQRPILEVDDRALSARPPERVHELLSD